MVDIQTVSIVLAACSFILAATYYVLNLKHQRETREAQLFMNIYNKMENPENTKRMQKVLFEFQFETPEEFNEKYGQQNNPEAYNDWMHLSDLLEGVGVFVREGLVDIRLVALLESGLITNYWRKYEIVWQDWRLKHDWPRAAIEVEYLYHRIIEYGKQHPELEIK